MTKSYMAKREEALAARRWHVIDAQDQVLGRVATRVASVLRGNTIRPSPRTRTLATSSSWSTSRACV